MKLIPTFERVLIVPDPEKEKTESGLIIPTDAQEPSNTGTIVLMGPLATEALKDVSSEGIKAGDKVMYLKYAGVNLTLNGTQVRMIMANDIVAKIEM